MAFLFGFNHEEAIRSFEAAAADDPNCPMAYWGLAMANGPHINNMTVDSAHAIAAWDALVKARALETHATPVERALINALGYRYSEAAPKDRRSFDKAYAAAIRAVWEAYPDDADVGALAAEAILDLRPWDYWTSEGRPRPGTVEAIDILDSVLTLSPRHPFALHLLIHAVEGSPDPSKATKAANILRELAPALDHLLHMPSHIDVRCGHWQEAIVTNEKAIAADDEYWRLIDRPRYGTFRFHNYHMLVYAAMMQGQEHKASTTIERMLTIVPDRVLDEHVAVYDGYFAMRYEVLLRFGRWDQMLAEPQPRDGFRITRAMWHFGRGIAHAAQNECNRASVEYDAFRAAWSDAPEEAEVHGTLASKLLRIADKMLKGEMLYREGKSDGAISALAEAVGYEDSLEYSEPPAWIVPTRHALGATLMHAGRYEQAEAVYRSDLKRHPENGWSLFGLCSSLEMQSKKAEAAVVKASFDRAWKHADFKISCSCCCLPGKSEAALK